MRTERRLSEVRRRLAELGNEAMLACSLSNVLYLTGFEGVLEEGAGACVLTADAARFYTDPRYSEAVEEAARGTEWKVCVQSDSLYVEMTEHLRAEGVESIAVESSIPYGRFRFISERFTGRVSAVDQLVEDIRQVKEAEEIERIAAAAELADQVFEHVIQRIEPGRTEIEIALDLEYHMRTRGSDGVAFGPIVASGPNSSRPHACPTRRRVADGDLVMLDLGARSGGYCSDMTRTFAVGAADARQREMYEAVLAANEAGIAAVRDGVEAADVDRAARDVLAERGMAELFKHGVGHGVGLDVHEAPTLNRRSTQPLRTGCVITIEPGAYAPAFAGVRIEDLVVVEERGARVLSRAGKELIEL